MKKLLALLLSLCAALAFLPSPALAEFDPESVSTPYIILMDASTGAILFEKNAHEHAFPASTTKIMTCILAIERCGSLDETVTVGENVEGRGSTANIVRREEMPLIDMLHAMMLVSGNDAAKAIAEHISGSESAFAELMNQKAAELGMADTHFIKSNGLHEEEHYTTAYDMALLTRYALKNESFRAIVSAETYTAAPTNKDSDGYFWENTNKLIHTKANKEDLTYEYATGVKTGDTAYAGRCLVASARKGGTELIIVLFGDYENKVDSDYRFLNAASFFEWGFANSTSVDVATLGLESTMELPVSGASLDDAAGGMLQINIDFTGLSVSGLNETVRNIQANAASITSTYALDHKLTAPVKAGDFLGTVAYQYDGATIFTAPMYASRDVDEAAAVVSSPSASPIIVADDTGEGDGGSNGVLFWILLGVVLVALVIAAKLIANRRRRRYARKRRAYRSTVIK